MDVTFPVSWTDKSMNWTNPDPFRADYWNALALAVLERLHITTTSTTATTFTIVPEFVSPGTLCTAKTVQKLRLSILGLMEDETWLSPEFVHSGMLEFPEIMPAVLESENRRGDYVTPVFLWNKFGISLRVPNHDDVDPLRIRGSFKTEYQRFLKEARTALDQLVIRRETFDYQYMSFSRKFRTMNLSASAYSTTYSDAWNTVRDQLARNFESASYREITANRPPEPIASLTARTLSGVGVSAAVEIRDRVITSPKKRTHCDFRVWQMYRASITDEWGTGDSLQDTSTLGHELCKDLGTTLEEELRPFFEPYPNTLPALPADFPETYPYTYSAPGIQSELGPILADFAIDGGFQFRPE